VRRLPLSTRDNKVTKIAVAKAWRHFTIWKYPAIFLFGLWGAVPALQPGVTGFKSNSDFLGGRQIERIDLKNIRQSQGIRPDWCMYDEMLGIDGDFRSSGCGVMLDGKKTLYSLKPINNMWNGSKTIYQYGTRQSMNLGAEGVDLARDWEWLKFFYGYDAISSIGGTAIRLQPFLANSGFIAIHLLLIFVAIDFSLALIRAVRKLLQAKSPK